MGGIPRHGCRDNEIPMSGKLPEPSAGCSREAEGHLVQPESRAALLAHRDGTRWLERRSQVKPLRIDLAGVA